MGVWIEIANNFTFANAVAVTPLVGVWIEISSCSGVSSGCIGHSPCGSVDWNMNVNLTGISYGVTPLVGVWIEMVVNDGTRKSKIVTPLVGVWIEIFKRKFISMLSARHSPCGSVDWNSKYSSRKSKHGSVTPLVGVWIEIPIRHPVYISIRVTPLVGVWIEILNCCSDTVQRFVTPLVGVWIEMT